MEGEELKQEDKHNANTDRESQAEEPAAKSDGEGCREPVMFYSDCTFQSVSSSVSIKEGMTLEKVVGSPKAVLVPTGCRVSLYSKTSLSFTSEHPSQALLIKGKGEKICLDSGSLKMEPVAIEINHDIDHAKLAKDVHDMKQSISQMGVRVPARRL